MKSSDYQPKYCPQCKDVVFSKIEQLMEHMKAAHQAQFPFKEYIDN